MSHRKGRWEITLLLGSNRIVRSVNNKALTIIDRIALDRGRRFEGTVGGVIASNQVARMEELVNPPPPPKALLPDIVPLVIVTLALPVLRPPPKLAVLSVNSVLEIATVALGD